MICKESQVSVILTLTNKQDLQITVTSLIPSISVDCVIFNFDEKTQTIKVLLVERSKKSSLELTISLPGDNVQKNELVSEAANRVLQTQTALNCPLYRFKSFEDPSRLANTDLADIRVITKGYLGFSNGKGLNFGSLATTGRFVEVSKVPSKMLYDHRFIFDSALDALKKAAENYLVPLDGMPETFTITEMQQLYEAILGKPLDKRNFRRSVLAKAYLEETEEYLRGTNFRPAKLYTYSSQKFQYCLDKELEKLPVILY